MAFCAIVPRATGIALHWRVTLPTVVDPGDIERFRAATPRDRRGIPGVMTLSTIHCSMGLVIEARRGQPRCGRSGWPYLAVGQRMTFLATQEPAGQAGECVCFLAQLGRNRNTR